MVLYVWKWDTSTNRFQKIALIDNASSVLWVKRFNSAGEFEIYVRASNEMFDLFHNNRELIVTREGDTSAMCVEKITLNTDVESGDYLTITGSSSENYLSRRIISEQTRLGGSAESGIRTLINQNAISPTDTNRQLKCVELGSVLGVYNTISKQITGDTLLKAVSDICVTYNYGFRFEMNSNNRFTFNLYKGINRSFDQSENTFVVFSSKFENLEKTEYSHDISTFSNVIVVAGEGEGTARKIETASTTTNNTGIMRREKWVDARNISSNNGEISLEQYHYLLHDKGMEQLALSKDTFTFSGEIINTNGYVYGVDYNLGDKVSIENEYGIRGNATIIEITEVEDENGTKLVPTLSEWSVE